jgi:hypothetical protein
MSLKRPLNANSSNRSAKRHGPIRNANGRAKNAHTLAVKAGNVYIQEHEKFLKTYQKLVDLRKQGEEFIDAMNAVITEIKKSIWLSKVMNETKSVKSIFRNTTENTTKKNNGPIPIPPPLKRQKSPVFLPHNSRIRQNSRKNRMSPSESRKDQDL